MNVTTTLHTFSRLLALLGMGGLCFSAPANAQEFSYNGDTGPGFWRELSPDWEACSGTAEVARQSPINIARVRIDNRLKTLDLQTFLTSVDIFNNGHTIEQHYEGTGSSISFEGNSYELQQFHLHTLSEHLVYGKQGVMELHAVFREPGGGDYLVLGMLYEIGSEENSFVQALIDAGLPEKDGDTTVTDDQIDVGNAFTTTRFYFTNGGSLTTPPCSETVTRVVLARPAKITQGQFQSFRRILGNNFRPTQALTG